MSESRSGGAYSRASRTEATHDAMEGGEVEGGRLPDYLQWWGKAQPADPASPSFHPIAYHSLDVAAVVRATLSLRAGSRRRAGRLLGVGDDDAIALCTALAALHDLGKFGNAPAASTPAWRRASGPTVRPWCQTSNGRQEVFAKRACESAVGAMLPCVRLIQHACHLSDRHPDSEGRLVRRRHDQQTRGWMWELPVEIASVNAERIGANKRARRDGWSDARLCGVGGERDGD